MNLGPRGKGRPGAGRQQGDRPRRRPRAGARGRDGRGLLALRGGPRGGRRGDGVRAGVPGRHRRPRPDGRAARRGLGGARARSTCSSPTRAGRRRAARSTTASSEWEEAYRTLVLSPKVIVEAALPAMRERGWGRIVNVASSSVREPIRGTGPLERAPDGDGGAVQDARGRGGGRRGDAQHRGHGQVRDRPPGARTTGRWRRRRRPPAPRCPPAGSGRPTSTATWSPSSARSAPPTSPAP